LINLCTHQALGCLFFSSNNIQTFLYIDRESNEKWKDNEGIFFSSLEYVNNCYVYIVVHRWRESELWSEFYFWGDVNIDHRSMRWIIYKTRQNDIHIEWRKHIRIIRKGADDIIHGARAKIERYLIWILLFEKNFAFFKLSVYALLTRRRLSILFLPSSAYACVHSRNLVLIGISMKIRFEF
jgi:hypothetical protein